MSDFVRVLADDPHYRGRKAYMHLHPSLVCKIYPVYGEITDKGIFRCTEEHPNAKVVSFALVDIHGKEYSCGDKDELTKLGFEAHGRKGRIGFICHEGGEKEAADLS